jgi:hypothetical protein
VRGNLSALKDSFRSVLAGSCHSRGFYEGTDIAQREGMCRSCAALVLVMSLGCATTRTDAVADTSERRTRDRKASALFVFTGLPLIALGVVGASQPGAAQTTVCSPRGCESELAAGVTSVVMGGLAVLFGLACLVEPTPARAVSPSSP